MTNAVLWLWWALGTCASVGPFLHKKINTLKSRFTNYTSIKMNIIQAGSIIMFIISYYYLYIQFYVPYYSHSFLWRDIKIKHFLDPYKYPGSLGSVSSWAPTSILDPSALRPVRIMEKPTLPILAPGPWCPGHTGALTGIYKNSNRKAVAWNSNKWIWGPFIQLMSCDPHTYREWEGKARLG